MTRSTRRSGLIFLLGGVLGAVFFWATDPRFGPNVHRAAVGSVDWRYGLFVLRGAPDNLIDAANQSTPGTFVGIAGSIALIVVGLWLLTRRTSVG